MTDQDKITIVLAIGDFEELIANEESARTIERLSVLKMYIKDIDQVIDRLIELQKPVDDPLPDSHPSIDGS